MKHYKNIIILMLLLFAGFANANPAKITNRAEYSQSINSIASVIMGWYGSLIETNKNQVQFTTTIPFKQWYNYRSQYPKSIKNIVVTGTKLQKEGKDYIFISHVKMINNQETVKELDETFLFSLSADNPPVIKSIHLNKISDVPKLNADDYNREHYKVREFVYAWLSHLDGLTTLDSVMNADIWLETARYSLSMGNLKITDSVSNILLQRKQQLFDGGHLLHSLTVNKEALADNTFFINLILEWKGKNQDGKPVIAKIHQTLLIQVDANGLWKVLSIKEKHLLPTIAPWMGLLC